MALTKISTDGVKDDAVTAGKIPANAVGTSEIADDAVTADKIANSINTAIAANTAKTSNATHTGDVTGSTSLTIANDAVTTAKIADGNVTTDSIADGSVNAGKLANNAVTTSKILDEAVSLAKLPHGTGSNDGKFLRANNGADPSFETVSIPAGTTINNNADNRVITGSGTANTLEGEAGLTYDGSTTVRITGSGQQQLVVGSTDAGGAAIMFDGDSNGDAAGGDYSFIRHNTDGDIEIFARNTGGATNTIFKQSTSEKVRIQAGGGISFNGDTAAANALDDYEEGTWNSTVYWQGGNTTGQSSHTTAVTGNYRKIGSLVFISILLHPASYNSGSDCVIIGYSLPFTPSGTAGLAMSMYGGWGNYGGWLGTGFHNYFARAVANGNGSVSVSSQTGGSGFWGHRGGYTGASGYVSGTYITA